jgi:hypothetical protein
MRLSFWGSTSGDFWENKLVIEEKSFFIWSKDLGEKSWGRGSWEARSSIDGLLGWEGSMWESPYFWPIEELFFVSLLNSPKSSKLLYQKGSSFWATLPFSFIFAFCCISIAGYTSTSPTS